MDLGDVTDTAVMVDWRSRDRNGNVQGRLPGLGARAA